MKNFKLILSAVLLLGLTVMWAGYIRTGSKVDRIKTQIAAISESGADPEEQLPVLETEKKDLEASRTINGIMLGILTAAVVSVFAVLVIVPWMAERFSQSVFDSAEMMEKDLTHDARSLVAQGKYPEAIAAYKAAAKAEPNNRLPWVEIAKIQKDTLHDPDAAIATTEEALASYQWPVNDNAYFLFRLAELYDEIKGDRARASEIMNQVIEQCPDTRHSANATHKLHEWEKDQEKGSLAAEEADFLARMKKGNS